MCSVVEVEGNEEKNIYQYLEHGTVIQIMTRIIIYILCIFWIGTCRRDMKLPQGQTMHSWALY